jgi:xanthine/uracil/vitamin C permease (AzgA family)
MIDEQVGCLMMRQVVNINWSYIGDAIPSFITLTFIPFSYSVAYGLIAYVALFITHRNSLTNVSAADCSATPGSTS